MPTLPRHGCMIAGRAGQRRVRRLRWSTERAKKKRENRRGVEVPKGFLGLSYANRIRIPLNHEWSGAHNHEILIYLLYRSA